MMRLLLTSLLVVGAADAGDSSAQLAELREKLAPSASDILASLDDYDKFWIKVKSGSCVWSECAVDDTDDGQVGDYRDGDEQWYQYRTQGFCANAAYTLYGRKKSVGGWRSCSQAHYINTFFTYGGADVLLEALGETPVVYYRDVVVAGDDDAAAADQRRRRRLQNDDAAAANDDAAAANDDAAAANDDAAAANDDANAAYDDANAAYDDAAANDDDSSNSNADCIELEDYQFDDDQAGNNARRLSGSGSGDNESGSHQSGDDRGYSSGLGCSASGDFIMAVFQSNDCDGNYFVRELDSFDDYNAQHSSIDCRELTTSYGGATSYDAVAELLGNSWDCNVALYPQCPDPYGEKKRYEYASRVAAEGGNPAWAYKNLMWKTPMKVMTWVLAALTLVAFATTFLINNRNRIKLIKRKGTKQQAGQAGAGGDGNNVNETGVMT
ncbi:hypothetical protein ACHAWF_018357 [Thalassiosira exigua]